MLEPDSPSRPFLGVHFLLFGFEPITERQVRSKLIDGGGVGVGQYSQSCTHVIVGRIVYDDPVCVAARNDGKTVVTGLWVDHSFDIGMPVDATSILYRPLRDLNGIPGAKSLTVCLTGYQRQDREDIMIMVGLMGAQFSKPLVANKVTHLICYKFEGEKYELAKKLKKIKLVNQRWLEGCLRDWELLPEADYNQSDYELEMMEAEAKDSDEEVGETATKQSAMRNIGKSPHDLKVRMLSATELPKSAMELPNPSLPEDPTNANSMEISLTTGKLNISSPSLNNLHISETHGCQETGASGNVSSVEFQVQPEKSPNSTKIQVNLASYTENDDKFTAIDSRKTPSRSTLPDFSGERSGNTNGSPEAMRLKDASDCYSPKLEQAKGRVSICHTESPLGGSSPYHGEDSAGILPQKRVMDASITNSKLQKTSHNAKAPTITSPDLNVANNSSVSIAKKASNANEKSLKNDLTSFLTVSEENRQNENAEKSPMSCRELRESNSASKSSVKSLHMEGFSHVVEEPVVPENKKQDVDSFPSGREPEMGQSYGTVNLDSVEGGSNKLDGERPKTKMLSKKTLGRPKVSNIANKKCSIYTNKIASENDPAICLSGVKERADHGSGSKEASPSAVSKDEVKEMTAKAVTNTAAKETKFVDNEAEAPDEKDKHEFEKTFNEEKSEFVDLANKADETRVTELSIGHSSAAMHQDMVASENAANETNLESAISNKKTKLNESTSTEFMKAKTEAPDEKDKHEFEKSSNEKKSEFVDLAHKADRAMETKHSTDPSRAAHTIHEEIVASEIAANETNLEGAISNKKTKLDGSTSPEYASKVKAKQVWKRPTGKAKNKTIPTKSKKELVAEETRDAENLANEKENFGAKNNDSIVSANELENSVEEENRPVADVGQNPNPGKSISGKLVTKSNKKQVKSDEICGNINSRRLPLQEVSNKVKCEPMWFIFSGHRYQRKEFQQVIKRLKGRCCRDSHQWSYQATHFIVPDPVRRTEKFFAAAASGRWVLKTDYLSASSQAGKFLPEEPYEWHKNGLSEDGAINLEAPRKWRLLRERTGHGAFYGMRIIVYGECIAPPLDTLKRVVKAGDGTILATSPPYTRFLKSGIDFAVISPGMPRDDIWVQEFLKYEIPCIVTDYLVEYVCKPGYSLERHVLYSTQSWAQKSLAALVSRANKTTEDLCTPPDDHQSDDMACQ
ncbi:hypothetical protein SLEP1_g1454 [Rubroshorea leprosula]|uniref:BRCT domain-containing protein n=1 Tax=Rubroshorea leprosula TaxID=152421 RepID=A0AAV5HNE7_9ROSI|nr:hypothetical protein SLEP1_g1454 [Rubroshorea leprosula]